MDVNTISYILQEKCQLGTTKLLVVGVSGGADSMSLLHMLWQHGYPIVAAHLDHGLRVNSARDAAFVKAQCLEWGIKLETRSVDVKGYCLHNHLGVEEGARELRYSFLFEIARAVGAAAVAVGHHADDQVETVLMHFIRGAGLAGLKGMPYTGYLSQFSSSIALVRPLLAFTRLQIQDYCTLNQVPYIQDETNYDSTYFRNRLRHELIPTLESFNPAFREVVLRGIETLQADYEIIEQATDLAWRKCLIEQQEDYISFDISALQRQVQGMRWNIVRRAVKGLQPKIRDFDSKAVHRLDGLISGVSRRKVELTNHLEARLFANRLWVCREDVILPISFYPQVSGKMDILDFPAKIALSNGWVLCADLETMAGEAEYLIHQASKYEAWLDRDLIAGQVLIRTRLPGEKMQSLGLAGKHARLTDLFINHQIPEETRLEYPVICDAEKVIWLPGISISDACKVTPATITLLHMWLQSPQG